MAQEYIVTAVSQDEPNEWNGPNGTIYYIKAKVQGHEKPLDVGKKTRDGLKVGDKIYGTIEETDYVTDKFKSASRPLNQVASTSEKKDWQPRDDMAIRAQWAIGQAVQLHALRAAHVKDGDPWRFNNDWVASHAILLFNMVDRVKGGSESPNPKAQSLGEQKDTTTSTNGWDKFKEVGNSFKANDLPIDDLPPLSPEELARMR